MNGPTKASKNSRYGRAPSVLVFLPTRELAKQDHLERNNSDFGSLKFRVLDEADEMLRMGFVEDVELILGILFFPVLVQQDLKLYLISFVVIACQDNAANVSLEVRGRFGDGGRGGFRRGGGGFFG
ncbi:hypothetical protein QYF36_014901 [Acer negundo]|nr:hypothetical protein QYF36_014901 [Acer negundo]